MAISNEYHQYTDFIFKRTVQKYANGVLKFLNIPYEIDNIILSEIASAGPKISRLDFAGEVTKNGESICIILECQTRLTTEEDITRFFQYISSLRILKNRKVELYILLTENAPYTQKEFVINDECVYIMNVISLKNIKAKEILNRIEDKIKSNKEITQKDIASLQLIAYTDYDETPLEIIRKATELVGRLDIEENEKEAIFYILNVLSTNMLNETDQNKLMEETKMILNPRERYFNNKGIEKGREEGIEETIPKLLEIMTPEEISKEYDINLEKVLKIKDSCAK